MIAWFKFLFGKDSCASENFLLRAFGSLYGSLADISLVKPAGSACSGQRADRTNHGDRVIERTDDRSITRGLLIDFVKSIIYHRNTNGEARELCWHEVDEKFRLNEETGRKLKNVTELFKFLCCTLMCEKVYHFQDILCTLCFFKYDFIFECERKLHKMKLYVI